MSKLVGTLLVAGLLVAGANAQDPLFRVFFDIEGTGGADNASHRPGDHNLSYGNPELGPGGGRLYIYGEFQRDYQHILSPNFDITIDGGIITEAWNYNGPGQDTLSGGKRWDAAGPNPAMNPGGRTVSFTAANLTQLGFKNREYYDLFDVQHDNTRDFGETMLGYVDVKSDPGVEATVWITVGEGGFAVLGGPGLIAFGYGDDSVRAGDPGVRTEIADATVVPEPGSVMLLGLGVLALRRRR